MSINLMNMIWSDRSGQLTLSETAILVRMASFAIEDGSSIYPSLQRIASDCKGTRRGIMKIIDSLIAKGYLQKIIRKTPDTNLTNYYYINTQKFNNDLLVNKPLSKKLSPEAVSESVENFKNPVDNNSEMVGNINSTDYLSGEQYSPGVVNHVHPKETNKEILLLKILVNPKMLQAVSCYMYQHQKAET